MTLTSGTVFVEITDPTSPIYIGMLPTHTECSTWFDAKVYDEYVFIVSEADNHGMQVFDLTQLLNTDPATRPIVFTETAHYDQFGYAHNIVINEASGFAYAVGTATYAGGLHIININDPLNPTFAGSYGDDGYTHDAQCVTYDGPDVDYTGREICFCYNENSVTLVDVTEKSSPIEISRTQYQGSKYTHQGWLTEDGNCTFDVPSHE